MTSQDGLDVFDPSTGKNTWYETYHPRRDCPYSTGAYKCLSNGLDREWRRQESSDSEIQEDAEEVDEYEDFVEELPSGIQDIIITGEVGLFPISLLPVRTSNPPFRRVKDKERLGVITRTLGEFGHGTV